MAFEDLRCALDCGCEFLEHVRRGLVERDLHEDEQAEPEPVRIETRAETGDHALTHESPEALPGRRGGQPDPLGKLDIGDPPILLEGLQDLAVDTINIRHIHSIMPHIPSNQRFILKNTDRSAVSIAV